MPNNELAEDFRLFRVLRQFRYLGGMEGDIDTKGEQNGSEDSREF